MRIYLDKLWLNVNVNDIQKYNSLNEDITYLMSSESIIVIQNNNLMNLNIYDGEIINYDDYIDNINVIIDTSIIKKSKDSLSHIPNNHIKLNKNIKHYKLRDKSPLTFIIEYISNEIVDFYFILEGYHAKYSNADLNNQSIKEDFTDFLKILKII